MESEVARRTTVLKVSMTKRLSHGFQFLASYTFSKTLDTDGADINSTSSGNGLTLGDPELSHYAVGRASFDRTHRFVISGIWKFPSPAKAFERGFLGPVWSQTGFWCTFLTIGLVFAIPKTLFGLVSAIVIAFPD